MMHKVFINLLYPEARVSVAPWNSIAMQPNRLKRLVGWPRQPSVQRGSGKRWLVASRWLARAAGLLLASVLVACSGSLGRTPKVLVIGIDGVRPDVLAEVATPNLDALAAGGWYTSAARTTTPSVSGPSWSSMLTGVWPDKHGVIDNGFAGRRYDVWPSFLVRVENARPEIATFAALDWVPLAQLASSADLEGDDPLSPGPLLPAAIDARIVVDGYESGWAAADSMVAVAAADHLTSFDPDAMFVYLGNPDETSHQTGSIGVEYRDAIALADRHVGAVVQAMRNRPRYETEDWLVLVSTDHGRRPDGGHGGDSPEEMTIFILASGDATVDWSPPGPAGIVDVAVTALDHLGIAVDPAWELDGEVLGGGGGRD